MAMDLVTGFAGHAHVDSSKWAKLNAAILGTGNYLMCGLGDGELKAYMATSNKLHAESGVIVAQGRQIVVDDDGIDWTVQNGTQDQKRIDMACIKYARNASTGIETITPVVIKGTPTAGTPVAPTATHNDLLNANSPEMMVPIFSVALDGTVPKAPQLRLEKLDTAADQAAYEASERAKLLPKTGGTITGPLVLSRTTDASGTADNRPALTIGGLPTQQHIEVDGNEIMAKADGTTPANLMVNIDGGDLVLGGAVRPKTPVAVASGGTGGQTQRQAADSLRVISLARGGGIPTLSDLNNYKTPGNFFCPSGNHAETYKNGPPINGGYKLIVWNMLADDKDAASAITQQAISWQFGIMCWRSYTSDNGWTKWLVMPSFLSGSDAWGYNSSSDTANFGTNSKTVIGDPDKTTILRGLLSGNGTNGANGTIFKRLWSGSVAVGGSITVKNSSDYNVLMCTFVNEGTAMIGARHVCGGGILRFHGALDTGGGGAHGSGQSSQASFTTDGDKLKLIGASTYYLYDNTPVVRSVGAIWGVL